jgi:hypothetical protein
LTVAIHARKERDSPLGKPVASLNSQIQLKKVTYT